MDNIIASCSEDTSVSRMGTPGVVGQGFPLLSSPPARAHGRGGGEGPGPSHWPCGPAVCVVGAAGSCGAAGQKHKGQLFPGTPREGLERDLGLAQAGGRSFVAQATHLPRLDCVLQRAEATDLSNSEAQASTPESSALNVGWTEAQWE